MKKRFSIVTAYILIIGGLLLGIRAGDRAIQVIAQQLPIQRSVRIVIDPGHGGEDGGATSCTGVLESNMNLEIALRLRDLMQFLGYEPVMIRTTDEAIHTKGDTISARKMSDLKERVRIGNEAEKTIYISLHQNTFSDSRYSGAQVFYGAGQGSAALAKQLQDTFASSLGQGQSRKCKKADGVYVMEHLTVTAVLVECGFLSNPQEEALLRSPQYQQRLAASIASAVTRYTALDGQTNG